MKLFKHKEDNHTITEYNPNHYSIYERMGYEEVTVTLDDKVQEDIKPKRTRKKKSE